MAIYKAITSATTTTLIAKDTTKSIGVHKITICNNSASPATDISVHLWAGGGGDPVHPFVHNVTIPKGATLVLEDNLAFNGSVYSLKMYSTGTAPALTVIIK